MVKFGQSSSESSLSVRSVERKQSLEDIDSRLEEITSALAWADTRAKWAKEERDRLRDEFFTVATERIEFFPLEQMSAVVPQGCEDIDAWVEREYPAWRILDVPVREQAVLVLLERDPHKEKFSYINRKVGLVFTRQASQVGSYFDVEGFRKVGAWAEGLLHSEIVFSLDEDLAADYLEANPERLPIVQQYAHPGKVQVKLAAPRKPKEEE